MRISIKILFVFVYVVGFLTLINVYLGRKDNHSIGSIECWQNSSLKKHISDTIRIYLNESVTNTSDLLLKSIRKQNSSLKKHISDTIRIYLNESVTSTSDLLLRSIRKQHYSASDNAKTVQVKDMEYCHYFGASMMADLAYPKGRNKIPAVICVHGGRWLYGDKNLKFWACNLTEWANFGYFAMNINYRTVKVSPAPACYQDVQCAIRFVHAHANKWNVDVKRIFVIGQSAGGHMAALAATIGDGPWPRTGGWEKSSNLIAAAVSVAGAYDLSNLSWANNWVDFSSPNRTELIDKVSPINLVNHNMKPMMLIHGGKDPSVPYQQFFKMKKAMDAVGVDYVSCFREKGLHMFFRPHVIELIHRFLNFSNWKSINKRWGHC